MCRKQLPELSLVPWSNYEWAGYALSAECWVIRLFCDGEYLSCGNHTTSGLLTETNPLFIYLFLNTFLFVLSTEQFFTSFLAEKRTPRVVKIKKKWRMKILLSDPVKALQVFDAFRPIVPRTTDMCDSAAVTNRSQTYSPAITHTDCKKLHSILLELQSHYIVLLSFYLLKKFIKILINL